MGAIRFSIERYTVRGRKRTVVVGKTRQVFDCVRNIVPVNSVNARNETISQGWDWMQDQSDLERFVEAQLGEIDNVRTELIHGSKCGHWMWYVFPQLRGLGHSWMANYYGISSLQEAEAYLRHPILGPRLLECTELVNRVEGRSIEEIFGGIDAVKFRSSMTLFAETDKDKPEFAKALSKYFAGNPDPLTLSLLKRGERG